MPGWFWSRIAPGPSRIGLRLGELPGLLPPGKRCLWRTNWTLGAGVWMYTPDTRDDRSYMVHGGGTWDTTGEVAEKFGSGLQRPIGSLPRAAWSGIVAPRIPGGRRSRFVSSVPLLGRRELPQGARRSGRAQGWGGARSEAARPPNFQPEPRRPAQPERRWAASLSTIASPSAA